MIKELDALKEIKETEIFIDFELNTTGSKMFEKQLDTIEKALKALEIIKEYFIFNGFDEIIAKGEWYCCEDDEMRKLLEEVLE